MNNLKPLNFYRAINEEHALQQICIAINENKGEFTLNFFSGQTFRDVTVRFDEHFSNGKSTFYSTRDLCDKNWFTFTYDDYKTSNLYNSNEKKSIKECFCDDKKNTKPLDQNYVFKYMKSNNGWKISLSTNNNTIEKFDRTCKITDDMKRDFNKLNINFNDIKNQIKRYDVIEFIGKYLYKIIDDDYNCYINHLKYGKPTPKNFKLREYQKVCVEKMKDYFNNDLDSQEKGEFLIAMKQRGGKNLTYLSYLVQDKNEQKDFNDVLFITYRPWVFSSFKNDVHDYFSDSVNVIDFKNDRMLATRSDDKLNVILVSSQLILKNTDEKKTLFDNLLKEYNKLTEKNISYNNCDDENIDEKIDDIITDCEDNHYQDINLTECVNKIKQYYNECFQKDFKGKIEALKDSHFKYIVVDEYHYGATGTQDKNCHSNFKTNVLGVLNYRHIIWMSGTAYKDLFLGTFNKEQIFIYDQIDENRAVKNGEIKMPKMKWHTIKIDDCVIDFYKNRPKEELPTLSKLLQPVKNKKNEDCLTKTAEEFLYAIFSNPTSKIKDNDKSLFQFCKDDEDGRCVMVLVDSVKSGKLICDFINNKLKRVNAINCCGSTDVVKTQEECVDKISKTDRNVILTCGRFVEGVSICEIDCVAMLYDGNSCTYYMQGAYRGQTPEFDKDGNFNKDICHVVDFKPDRMLNMHVENAYICLKNHSDENKPQKELIKEYLDAMPIWDLSTNQQNEGYSYDEFLNDFQNRIHKYSNDSATKNCILPNLESQVKDILNINGLADMINKYGGFNHKIENPVIHSGKTNNKKHVCPKCKSEITDDNIINQNEIRNGEEFVCKYFDCPICNTRIELSAYSVKELEEIKIKNEEITKHNQYLEIRSFLYKFFNENIKEYIKYTFDNITSYDDFLNVIPDKHRVFLFGKTDMVKELIKIAYTKESIIELIENKLKY